MIIPNPVGTAPGFRVTMSQGKSLIWLSGVPQEMTAMFNETVMPWITAERGKTMKFSRARLRSTASPSRSWTTSSNRSTWDRKISCLFAPIFRI